MPINHYKKESETQKDIQITSLKISIYSWVKNNLIPLLFFLLLSIFIFRNMIGVDGIIIQGDFIYSPNLENFSQDFYLMWNENIGLNSLSTLPRLLFYLPFIEIGLLFNIDTTNIMVILFIFCEFLAGISMYYTSKYLLRKTYAKSSNKTIKSIECPYCKNITTISGFPGKKATVICPNCAKKGFFIFPEIKNESKLIRKIYSIDDNKYTLYIINLASLVAGISYMWSSFFLQNYLFIQHQFAYALAPFIVLSIVIGIEKNKIRYIILTGLLWSLACADLHWTIFGAIILFTLILYYFILRFTQLLPFGKSKALITSILIYIKYSITLLVSFICFSSYWFLPGFLMGGTSRYPAILFSELNIARLTPTILLDLIADWNVHLYRYQEILFNTTSNILNTSIVQIIFFSMGIILFIFSLIALLLRPKNRYVLFFSIFTLITLFLSSIPIYSEEFNYWFITKAPLSNLYGWVFKRVMISQFLIMTLSFLLGFSIFEIINRINKSKQKNFKLKKVMEVAIICFLLFSILTPKWPLATGDYNGWLKPVEMPNEFEQANTWLETQKGDFKVLWLPKYYGTNIDWYSGNSINKDIAGLSSSKPTYSFWGPAKQPNGYGIYFFGSSVQTYNSDSLFLSNATRNIGKFLAPLGIKYIIFHDDNATSWDEESYTNADDLFNVLKYQEDLELIKEFGFIYVFENKYYDEENNFKFFSTSNDFLIFGGLGSIATLNSLPYYNPRYNGLIFSNQMIYDSETVNLITDDLIFTKSLNLEEVAFTFLVDKYFIIPFDYSDSINGYENWTKIRLNSMKLSDFISNDINKGNSGEWEFDYSKGIIYTWSTGKTRTDYSLNNNELIKNHGFETDILLDYFTEDLTSNIIISKSNYSMSGDKSIMGKIGQEIQNKVQYAKSGLSPFPNDVYKYRISYNLAAENVINVQVKQIFFNEQKEQIGAKFLTTRSGTFNFIKFESDITPPAGTKYYSIQILSDQNPINDSYWWIDDIQIYNLKNITTYAKLHIDFNVENNDNYEFFIRYLKSENGGKIDIYLDGKQINSLNTFDNLNNYYWEKINFSYLTMGFHTMDFENIVGFNAINLIAAVPESKMDEYYETSKAFIENKTLVYILEAESDFYFENAEISETYGNLASFGKVLSLQDNGRAWLPLQIIKSGNYSMSIKWIGGNLVTNLILSIDNRTLDLGYFKESNFTWTNITNISLGKGDHHINLSLSPFKELIAHLSFEGGWNSTGNAPKNWSQARSQFKMSLDPLNKTDGEHSLMITTNSTEPLTYSRVINEEITLESNKSYEARIDIKTENVNTSHVKIMGYNYSSDGWEDIAYVTKDVTGTKDWDEYKQLFFLPENISKIRVILNVGWVLNTTQGNATIWFDDFEVVSTMEKINADIDLVVLYLDEANESLEQIFNPIKNSTVLDYTKIDDTKYEVEVSANEPFMLSFASTYDEFWVASTSGSEEIASIPIYGMLNGFYINKTGNFTVIIEYKPQQWFNIGAGITAVSIVMFVGYVLWDKSRGNGKKLITSIDKIRRILIRKNR